MALTRKTHFLCLSIMGVLSTLAAAQPRVFVVPEDGDPAAYSSGTTVLNLFAGNQACVEFWATGEPTDIFGVQLKIGDALGGDAGSVTIVCASVIIDTNHASFINLDSAIAIPIEPCCSDPTCSSEAGYINTLFVAPPASVPLPTAGNYLGELCYQTSADASGTFTSNWILPGIESFLLAPDGATKIPNVIYDGLVLNVTPCLTNADCDDADVCTRDVCTAGSCSFPLNAYGDVDHNGSINIFDLFCVLNGFAGDFTVCPFEDIDIDPCTGNGSIDIFDLFAVLNAFAAMDPCCGGLP